MRGLDMLCELLVVSLPTPVVKGGVDVEGEGLGML
jgi:hypothetical protein